MTSTQTKNSTDAQKQHSSSFGQTLQFITSIKLSELEKQSASYKVHSATPLAVAQSILQRDATSESNPPTTPEIIKAVEQLSKCIKSWTGSGSLPNPSSGIVSGSLQLKNLEYWLQQAHYDPEFAARGGSEHAKRWLKVLDGYVKKTQMRFDAAMLFGKLFNEWIGSGDSSAVAYQGPNEDGDGLVGGDDKSATADDVGADVGSTFSEFVEVGRKEMYEQRQKLVSIIFDDYPIDTTALKAYLEELFSGEEPQRSLEWLRRDIKSYGALLLRQSLTTKNVDDAIKGLLAGGLMDEEKRTTLKAFQENKAAMEELASVLTMRVASLGGKDGWKWPKEGVKVEMRRALNGKYRAFTDPDVIDALLLQHLGIAWQSKFKGLLLNFFHTKAWKRPAPVPHQDQEKRKAQLDDDGIISIRRIREDNYQDYFFMSQLADSLGGSQAYDDLVDAPEKQKDNDDDDGYPSSSSKSPAEVKQKLFNIIQTESYLNTALHGTHTILRSDLEWFGPSLPHSSILTILEFLGMGKKWLRFYKEFLEAPVKFTGAGGFGTESEAEPRVRRRGTPISYALSVVCGEAVLFIMDYAVNRRSGASSSAASGGNAEAGATDSGIYGETVCLYRMHDDLWVWDRKKENVVRAWKEMKTFASLVGLKFNESKTGSVVVCGEGATDEASSPPDSNDTVIATTSGNADQDLELPKGDIRWGFLLFSSPSDSSTTPASPRFVIDQAQVDQHITELRRQLDATNSIFGWVNLWNKYMKFFVRNFGAAGGGEDDEGNMAPCAAEKAAVVDIVETLARIQREVLSGEEGKGEYCTALGYLRQTLESRFGVKDLPDGYFYFPISSGGLELWNPMVDILALEREGKPLLSYEERREKDKVAEKAKATEEGDEESEDSDEDDDSDADADSSYSSDSDRDVENEAYFYEYMYLASSKFPARMRFDAKEYKNLKEAWDNDAGRRRTLPISTLQSAVPEEFMSREEYEGLREGWLKGWAASYEDMLGYVDIADMVCVPKITELIAANPGGTGSVRGKGTPSASPAQRASVDGWSSLVFYERWVMSVYGEEVVERFGGLDVVDQSLIPVGMVQLFRTSRMKLDQ